MYGTFGHTIRIIAIELIVIGVVGLNL